jgi:general secretion pathway protein E/type IV pilus assembly protein PilB
MDQDFIGHLHRVGLLDANQARIVTQQAAWQEQPIDRALEQLDFVAPELVFEAWQAYRKRPFVQLEKQQIDPRALHLWDEALLKKHRCLPFGWVEGRLQVALDHHQPDVGEIFVRNQLELHQRCDFFDIQSSRLDALLIELAPQRSAVQETLQAFDYPAWQRNPQGPSSQWVVNLLEEILSEAVQLGASDIHFEPSGASVKLRYRINGVLQAMHELHPAIWQGVLMRLKVLGHMEVTEQSVPQDGRFEQIIHAQRVSFRMASMPVSAGESMVVRLLPQGRTVPQLSELHLDPLTLQAMHWCMEKPEGLVLVAGPTGSGKSTSLAAMLSVLRGQPLAVLSLENPIEYRMDWVRQTEINEARGLTFATGMRGMMRLDPDVMLVGEIRDEVTAQTAVQAARTGHFVLASVHASHYPQVLGRMADLGVQPEVLLGVLEAVFVQRLVRLACKTCGQVGCSACQFSGYAGRKPLIEVWSAQGECGARFEQQCEEGLQQGWLTPREHRRVFGRISATD